MQARKSVVTLAVASLAAFAGAAFAHGPGYGFGATDPAAHAERVHNRLEALKAALQLQPAQLDAWNAYAQRLQRAAAERAKLRQGLLEHPGDAQASADQRVTMMKHTAQAAEETNELRKRLAATLGAEQKATLDRYAVGARFAGAPGRGLRGPGLGRGCIGMS